MYGYRYWSPKAHSTLASKELTIQRRNSATPGGRRQVPGPWLRRADLAACPGPAQSSSLQLGAHTSLLGPASHALA